MTTRIKTILAAPVGVEEALILGVPYYVDEEGMIETYSADHAKILKQHGFTHVSDVAVGRPTSAPARQLPAINDIDDMGRSDLAAALTDRGVSFPPTSSRSDLADIAESWNARRAAPKPPLQTKAEAAAGLEPPTQNAAPEPATAPEAQTLDEQDFEKLSWDDLKGWLAARGVAFAGNASKPTLVKVAQDYTKAMKSEPEAV